METIERNIQQELTVLVPFCHKVFLVQINIYIK